jgi:bacillolysin
MRHRSWLAAAAAPTLAASTAVVTATTSSAAPVSIPTRDGSSAPSGSFALGGAQARDFTLPADLREVSRGVFPDGSTQTRYQQVVDDASVFGGQVTVLKDAAARTEAVVGAYFPGLEPKNSASLSKKEARDRVEAEIGTRGQWNNQLRIQPRNGRLFYEVESIPAAHRPVRWVDAGSGRTLKSLDVVAHGSGTGGKGDEKTVDTTFDSSRSVFELRSGDDRQLTFDWQNSLARPVVMTDPDDVWDLDRGTRSPSQPAGVDAHYYADVVDDFFADTFGRDSIDGEGMQIISVVHFGNRYCNAFWNGAYMSDGDGDGDSCLPLSGGLDVDGHELTHGVTEFTSGLTYEDEPGALNEAFSDMMGNTVEFYAEDNGLDPAAEPDWLIGEDVVDVAGDPTPGFRNMADPKQDGDPSHVSQQYTGDADHGGVHTNSGIANHALPDRERRSQRLVQGQRLPRRAADRGLRRHGPGARAGQGDAGLQQGLHLPARVRQLLRHPQRDHGGGEA